VAPSLIDKFEQILAADPRSLIFVELARALLERGDPRRATEVCRAGLEHHPNSILGRVTWGRALLQAGDPKGAQDQFDVAIGIDPGTPYAYNLVGDALVAAGLFREALPVLARAAELQPADAQARTRLEEARRRGGGGTAVALRAVDPPLQPTEPDSTSGAPPGLGGPTVTALPAVATPAGTEEPASPPPGIGAQADGAPVEDRPLRLELEDRPDESDSPAPVPAPPPVAPPRKKRLPGPRTLLSLLPAFEPELADRVTPAAAHHHDEAARVASVYEQELRAKAAHLEAQATAPTRWGRVIAMVALAAVVIGAGGTFAWFRARSRSEELQRTFREARVGLARDTRGALTKAAEVLARARGDSPDDPRLLSLVAQVNGVLASDHGDAAARALALELTDPSVAGDGALAVRWLLAGNATEKAEAATALVTTAAGATPEPMLHRLAGEALLVRGELDSGRARLEKAAASTPPDLAAMALLGDSFMRSGDPERALAYFEAALGAQPTHPRSVMGAAEARLALSHPLDGSSKELAAVEADRSSPPPVREKLRFELTYARVLAATGEITAAVRRLTLAAGALGDSSKLEAVRTGVLLDARRWGEAEAAAAKAVRLEPQSTDFRVLLARARNGARHHAAALQALEGRDGRSVWLERGIAYHGLGRQEQARAALEQTIRDGKMPGDAAIWYARADVALGHADRAVTLLTRLASAPGSAALAHATLGEALLAVGRPAEAETACQAAISRDAGAPEGHRCLGQFLLGDGRPADAVAPLQRAVAIDPADPEARRLLAAATAPPAPTAPRTPAKKAPARKGRK
jgi:predicted Zn-dependent protease